MNVLITTQFEEMCRTCMIESSNVQFRSIFEYIEDFKQQKIQILKVLNETIQELPKIEITDDELPKKICENCIKKLTDFYEFQNCCINSDAQLRKLISIRLNSDIPLEVSDPLQNEVQIKEEIIDKGVEDFGKIKNEEDNDEELLTTVPVDVCKKKAKRRKNDSNKSVEQKSLNSSSDLKKQWTCTNCKRTFPYKRNLLRHMQDIHKISDSRNVKMNDNDQEPPIKTRRRITTRNYNFNGNDDNNGLTLMDAEIILQQKNKVNEMQVKNDETFNEIVDIKIKEFDSICDISNEIEKQCKQNPNDSNKVDDDVDDDDENQHTNSKLIKDENNGKSTTKFTCMKCNRIFLYKRRYKEHLLIKHKERSETDTEEQSKEKSTIYECNKCDTIIKSHREFLKHLKRHEDPDGLKNIKICEICNKGYRTRKKLLEHYLITHPERLQSDELPVPEAIKPIFCPHCKKGVGHLAEHLRTHTKERPYLCPRCGKGYSSKSTLKQHILRHDDEKHYSCPECPKKFSSSSDLSSHKYVHRSEKPHVCDICGKAFKKTYDLSVHKNIHKIEKKYKCEYCGRNFTARDHLLRHTRMHTGEKPHQCKHCPRSFSQSGDMMKHMKSHVGDNIYECELCPAAFPFARELRAHFYTHKNDDEETKKRNKEALLEAQEKLQLKLRSTTSENRDHGSFHSTKDKDKLEKKEKVVN